VVGVAADGVARVVLRIPMNQAGQDVKVEVCGDKEDEATCGKMPVDEYGGITLLPTLTSAKTFASNVVAKSGPVDGAEPHAFAVYRAPLDFTRLLDQRVPRACRICGNWPILSVSCE